MNSRLRRKLAAEKHNKQYKVTTKDKLAVYMLDTGLVIGVLCALLSLVVICHR